MKHLVILFILSTFVSCSMFSSKQAQDYEILTGEVNPETLSTEEIKSELIQKETMAVRSFEIKVYPLIDSYIKRADIEKELLNDLPSTTEKTCFMTEIRIDSHNKKSADFKSWKAEAINHESEFIHMEWTPVSSELTPVEKNIGGYTGEERRYTNKGVLCAVDKITMSKFFQVKLSPQVVQWPLKQDITFTWNIPQKKVVDGKVVKVKRKKKVQKYKGW
ncbi:MAG: hypothetical protein KC493_09355 [Bacteriovoracaceae bacterium]|nr:hypothetical protein [Bacteriovoracaceae bacterium]